MARVTVEDCIEKVPNRFELVMLAAHRSRGISAGAPPTVDRDNDKNPVVALREIADETIGVEETHDSLIRGMQRNVEVDEPEEEDALELMAGAMMAGVEADAGDYIRDSEPADLDEDDDPAGLDAAGDDQPDELDMAGNDEPVEPPAPEEKSEQ